MVTAMVVVWVWPPPVPVTVTVRVPTPAPRLELMVSVTEPGMEDGLKLNDRPLVWPETDSEMLELKPPAGVAVMATGAALPRVMLIAAGVAESEKLGCVAAVVTVSDTVAVWVVEPLAP